MVVKTNRRVDREIHPGADGGVRVITAIVTGLLFTELRGRVGENYGLENLRQ